MFKQAFVNYTIKTILYGLCIQDTCYCIFFRLLIYIFAFRQDCAKKKYEHLYCTILYIYSDEYLFYCTS